MKKIKTKCQNFKKSKNYKRSLYLLKINFFLILSLFITYSPSEKIKKDIKVALCTIGKKENLYIKEFVDYYIRLGMDHIFLYDDNDPNTENMADVIGPSYQKYVTITKDKNKIKFQNEAYNDCYKNHNQTFDWLLMIDMDEYLFITKHTLKNYLTLPVFNKCDFIKFCWKKALDNDLMFYDNRSLFERFKPPYLKSGFIKSIIRGNIPGLHYSIHSPGFSPVKNKSCTSSGKRINKPEVNFEYLSNRDFKLAYMIHFKYKSSEEYIRKYKRGYSNWLGDNKDAVLLDKIEDYFLENRVTLEKIDYFEKELKLNLSKFRSKIKK